MSLHSDELRYFLAAYENGSLALAAKQLSISAQGLGRAITKLEHKLGVNLFVRTHSGITPTDPARRVYEDSKSIVGIEDALLSYLDDYQNGNRSRFIGQDSEIGDVIKSGFDAYNATHEPPIVCELLKRTDDEIAQLLLAGSCDYRFVNRELDTTPWLTSAYLGTQEYYALVNRDSSIAEREVVSLDDLADMTILAERATYTFVGLVKRYFQDQNLLPRFRFINVSYILKLLRTTTDCVWFTRSDAALDFLNVSDQYRTLRFDPPIQSTLMLQTTRGAIPQDLLTCIKKALDSCGFVDTHEKGL